MVSAEAIHDRRCQGAERWLPAGRFLSRYRGADMPLVAGAQAGRLAGMGLEVLSRADIGVRQYGADVAAVVKDHDGKRKLFLFSVKRGDLSRSEWNGGSDQALQPSLDEIRYVYHRSVAPEHKELPVVIVAVLGGIVPQSHSAMHEDRAVLTGHSCSPTHLYSDVLLAA